MRPPRQGARRFAPGPSTDLAVHRKQINKPACSSMSFSQFETFDDWLIGKAGFDQNTKAGQEARTGNHFLITERRPSTWGHFRLPELLYQPVGGGTFPRADEIRVTRRPYRHVFTEEGVEMEGKYTVIEEGFANSAETIAWERGHYWDSFSFRDAGLVEVLVPYRVLSSDCENKLVGVLKGYVGFSLGLLFRVPAYLIHDVVKTAMIPSARAHFRKKVAGPP
jgi:hypothetical protein